MVLPVPGGPVTRSGRRSIRAALMCALVSSSTMKWAPRSMVARRSKRRQGGAVSGARLATTAGFGAAARPAAVRGARPSDPLRSALGKSTMRWPRPARRVGQSSGTSFGYDSSVTMAMYSGTPGPPGALARGGKRRKAAGAGRPIAGADAQCRQHPLCSQCRWRNNSSA